MLRAIRSTSRSYLWTKSSNASRSPACARSIRTRSSGAAKALLDAPTALGTDFISPDPSTGQAVVNPSEDILLFSPSAKATIPQRPNESNLQPLLHRHFIRRIPIAKGE